MKKKFVWWYSVAILLAAAVLLLAGYGLSVRANLAYFYPQSCLGGWQNPQKAAGEPDLRSGSPPEHFNETNSAVLKGTIAQIFCGDFRGEAPEDAEPKHFVLHLSWALVEQEPDAEFGELLEAVNPSGSGGPAEAPPVIELPEETPAEAPAEETPVQEAPPEVKPPPPEPPPPPVDAPAPSEELSWFERLFERTLAQTDTVPATAADFLEIQYTLDSVNWHSLGRVGRYNWPEASLVVPIESWLDINSLQISIQNLATVDDQPVVYLDGMSLEVGYGEGELVPLEIFGDLPRREVDADELFDFAPEVVAGNEAAEFILQGVDKVDLASERQQEEEIMVEPPSSEPEPSTRQEASVTAPVIQESPTVELFDKPEEPAAGESEPSVSEDEAESGWTPSVQHESVEPGESTVSEVSVEHSVSNSGVSNRVFTLAPEEAAAILTAPFRRLARLFIPLAALAQPPRTRLVGLTLLTMNGEEVPVRPEFAAGADGRLILHLPPGDGFRPGRFRLRVEVWRGAEIAVAEQEFAWGVLAINVNKSILEPDERAYLQMAVLDDSGHTICDGDLQLTISHPEAGAVTLSTEAGTIVRNPTCGPDNITDEPDYFAFYRVSFPGRYKLTLTNLGNGYEVTDAFEAQSAAPFAVERVGATRINPFAGEASTYTMRLKITARQNFSGEIVETVPGSFVVESSSFTVEESGKGKKLIAKVNLRAGEEIRLAYDYRAPNISPYLWRLGPLRIGGLFAEARQWQLAADLTCNSQTGGSGSWNNSASWSCGQVPTTADSVVITTNQAITVDVNTAAVTAVTINTGASLTISGSACSSSRCTLSLAGTFTRSGTGTLTANTGKVTFNANASITTFSGTFTDSNAFYDLQFSPAQGGNRTYTGGAAIDVTNNFDIKPTSATGNRSFVYNLGGANTITGTLTNQANAGGNTASLVDVTASNHAITAGKIVNDGSATTGDTKLDIRNSTLTLTGTSGTIFSNNETFTVGGSSVVIFNGNGSATLTSNNAITFDNVQLTPALSGGAKTYTFGNQAMTVNGNFDIKPTATAASQSLTVNMGANITVGATKTTTIQPGATNSPTATLDSTTSNFNLSTGLLNVDSQGGGGTLNIRNSTLTLTGTSGTIFTKAGTFTVGGSSTTIFNGAGSPTLTSNHTFTFDNLQITPTIGQDRTYTFGSGALTVNGDFTVNPNSGGGIDTLTVNLGADIAVAAGKTTTLTKTSANTLLNFNTTGSNHAFSTGLLNIATGATLTANNSAITLTGTSGTLFTRAGTFTQGGSTVVFNGDGSPTLTSGTITFNNLTLSPTITAARIYTFGSDALTVDGDFTVNPTASSALELTVNMGANITVAATKTTTITRTTSATSKLDTVSGQNRALSTGHLTIEAGGTLAANNSAIAVSGNWVNNGTFTAGGSTVTLNGSAKQNLAGTLVGASGAFYALTITNNSGASASGCERTGFTPSVDFGASASTTNNFTITAADVRVEYESGALYTFQNINWNGQAAGSRIYFRNSVADSGTWRLAVPGTQTAVSFVNVSRSDASAVYGGTTIVASNSTDCDNNTNWNFGAPSLTFTVTSDDFPAAGLNPGAPIFATTTLKVDTSNSTGWNVTLYGDDRDNPLNNSTMDHDSDGSVAIPDAAQWIPGSATTTAGNALRLSLLPDSGRALAFRLMTASGTLAFISTAWWGAVDDYADNASTLWGGFASGTPAGATPREIGNSSVPASGGSAAFNTVLYYLDVPDTQQVGGYSGTITFTATVN